MAANVTNMSTGRKMHAGKLIWVIRLWLRVAPGGAFTPTR